MSVVGSTRTCHGANEKTNQRKDAPFMGLKEMLDLARRYWEVAARMTDEQAKQDLLDLAQRYEALANQLRAATCTD